jgi:hypothetical protein
MHGAIGLAGLILLRDRLATYVRPFVAGLDVEERLTAAMESLKPTAENILRADIAESEDTRKSSPVSARVFTNGQQLSIYYSWEQPEKPEAGWELAGTVYLSRAASGNWKVQTHLRSGKWEKIVQQAARLFEAKMTELQDALRSMEAE